MNHLIFFEQDLEKKFSQENCYSISDPFRIDHLKSIIDVQKESLYKAILIDKGLCYAKCLHIEAEKITFQLYDFSPGEERQYDLLIGLSRPQTVKKILEYSSGQPVKNIYFYKAELSEKSYATSKVFDSLKLSQVLSAGLSQCGRYQDLPQIKVLKYFPEKLISGYKDKYILSLKSNKTILDHQEIIQTTPLLAFGPERGFTDSELLKFKELEFKEILLSKSILRVETAIIAFCSQLELLNFQK